MKNRTIPFVALLVISLFLAGCIQSNGEESSLVRSFPLLPTSFEISSRASESGDFQSPAPYDGTFQGGAAKALGPYLNVGSGYLLDIQDPHRGTGHPMNAPRTQWHYDSCLNPGLTVAYHGDGTIQLLGDVSHAHPFVKLAGHEIVIPARESILTPIEEGPWEPLHGIGVGPTWTGDSNEMTVRWQPTSISDSRLVWIYQIPEGSTIPATIQGYLGGSYVTYFDLDVEAGVYEGTWSAGDRCPLTPLGATAPLENGIPGVGPNSNPSLHDVLRLVEANPSLVQYQMLQASNADVFLASGQFTFGLEPVSSSPSATWVFDWATPNDVEGIRIICTTIEGIPDYANCSEATRIFPEPPTYEIGNQPESINMSWLESRLGLEGKSRIWVWDSMAKDSVAKIQPTESSLISYGDFTMANGQLHNIMLTEGAAVEDLIQSASSL